MKRYLFLWAIVAVICLLSAACGSEDGNNDTDGDIETESDSTVDGDENGDEDVTDGDQQIGDEDQITDGDIDEDTDAEAASEEDTEQTASCMDFSGAYYLDGSCDSQLLTFFNFACVRQNDNCELELYANTAAFEGTASGSEFELSSVYSASPTTCTGSQNSVLDPINIECHIPAFNITCTGEASDMPEIIDDISTTCCDVMEQDCAEGELCTYVSAGDNMPAVSACRAISGSKQENETCTRSQSDAAGVGRDDCDKGLTCVNYGQPDFDTRVCRKFCDSDDDCAQGEGCINASNRVPRLGSCSPTCDQWGDGSDCVEGATCAMMTSINRENDSYIASPFCMPGGSVSPGGNCSYNYECTTGYVCSPFSYTCKPLCDDDHVCANASEECVSVAGYSYTFCENTK